jgi:S-adenosylmethionine hydrolase
VPSSRLITLLTDFGLSDSYVAEVKGVLLSRAPGAVLVDVTHQVPPGDVPAGQFLLARAWRRFPAGTVHLAVVDPGVGTTRRALAAAAGGHWFVAPDNGLLSFLEQPRFVSLPIPADAAPTFHGRDVFAPAAASLAAGARLEDLGSPVSDATHAPLPTPHHDGTAVMGEVLYVDRFGTLISNIPGPEVEPGVRIRVAGTEVGSLRRTFGDVERGTLVALVGSGGTVEIAVRDGSAARLLGVGVGAEVRA